MVRKTDDAYYENRIHIGKPPIAPPLKKQSADFQAIFIRYDKKVVNKILKTKTKYQLKSKLNQNQPENNIFVNIRSLLGNEIQYLAIINKQGKIENILGNEIALSSQRKEMFGMSIRLQNSLQQDFDDEFGSINYITIERENSRFFLLPYSSYVILAITSKHLEPVHVINKIKGIKWDEIWVKQPQVILME